MNKKTEKKQEAKSATKETQAKESKCATSGKKSDKK